jgi:molybdopterin biosynthesis enzyme
MLLPVLRRLAGREGPGWVAAPERFVGNPLRAVPGLTTVVPLVVDSGRVRSVYHGSSSISSLSGAQGFAWLPPGRTVVRSGDRLSVRWLLPPLGPGAGPPSAGNG